MIRLIILYYRLQGNNQEVTVASATENAGSIYSSISLTTYLST